MFVLAEIEREERHERQAAGILWQLIAYHRSLQKETTTSMQGMRMKRTTLNFWTDALAFIGFVFLTTSGVLLRYQLPLAVAYGRDGRRTAGTREVGVRALGTDPS